MNSFEGKIKSATPFVITKCLQQAKPIQEKQTSLKIFLKLDRNIYLKRNL